jgi:hypothetical protein
MIQITKSDTIRSSEKEFIDTINAELDWGALESMLLHRHRFHLRDEVDYRGGDLVVHGDRIAYKLDFEVRLSLSVIVDRNGECLEITSSADPQAAMDEGEAARPETGGADAPGGGASLTDFSSMASSLAEMISDINQGGD